MSRFLSLIALLTFVLITNAQNDTVNATTIMQMSLEELMKVKVQTASKQSEDISDIPASAVIISRQQIKEFGWKSLTEILMNVPGLYLIDQHKWNGMTGFGVRGFFTEGAFSNFLIMVNQSIVSREGYSNQYIIDRIGVSVESIDRIEVIRGPMSVIYGNGAFFGAINIITNCEVECKSNPNMVNVSYGTNNTKRTALHVAKKVENVSVDFNVSYKNTQGADMPYTDFTLNELVDVNGETITYLQSVGLSDDETTKNQLSKDEINLNVSTKVNDITFFINHTHTEKGIIWQAPSIDSENNNAKISGTDAKIEYDKQINDHLNIVTRLNLGDYHSLSTYSILSDDFSGFSNIKSSIVNAEAYAVYKPNKNIGLLAGIMEDVMIEASNRVDIPTFGVANSVWRVKPGDKIKSHDAYVQLNYSPLPKVKIIAGVRMSKLSKYTYERIINEGYNNEARYQGEFSTEKPFHTYRIAAIAKPIENHSIKLLFGTSMVAPNMRQQTTWLTANNGIALVPSKIKTYEFNYRSLLMQNIIFSASYYINEIDDLIESSGGTTTDGNYTVITQNSGEKHTNGIEADVTFKPMKSFYGNLGFSYQESKNMKEGSENILLGYSPTWQGFFKFSYNIKEYTFALSTIYVDEMLPEINPRNNERYGMKVDSYVNLNLNVRCNSILKSPFYAEFYINNLLNNKIMFPTDATNIWADQGLPGPLRNFLITVGYQFNKQKK